MKRSQLVLGLGSLLLLSSAAICNSMLPEVMAVAPQTNDAAQPASEKAVKPTRRAVQRTRDTVAMLDNIFKQTVVMITDKYVHTEDDFAAGSAAVLLFKNISESGENKIRLIDATGNPYESANVAKDDFEKEGLKQLLAGANMHEQVVKTDGKSFLRALTPVPVVMEKCVMCHAHYADAKAGLPIGAISYTIPIK